MLVADQEQCPPGVRKEKIKLIVSFDNGNVCFFICFSQEEEERRLSTLITAVIVPGKSTSHLVGSLLVEKKSKIRSCGRTDNQGMLNEYFSMNKFIVY